MGEGEARERMGFYNDGRFQGERRRDKSSVTSLGEARRSK